MCLIGVVKMLLFSILTTAYPIYLTILVFNNSVKNSIFRIENYDNSQEYNPEFENRPFFQEEGGFPPYFSVSRH